MDLQQNGVQYGPTKLDNKLSENVQDIKQSHKLYRENYENLENWIGSKKENLCRSKCSECYIPGRCTITITICNKYDTTQQYTKEMHWRIQT